MLVETLLPAAHKKLVTVADDAPHGSAGFLSGVITKTDVVRQISNCQGATCIPAASLVMTRDVVVCRPTDWLHEVWSRMKERGFKNVPIADPDSRPSCFRKMMELFFLAMRFRLELHFLLKP